MSNIKYSYLSKIDISTFVFNYKYPRIVRTVFYSLCWDTPLLHFVVSISTDLATVIVFPNGSSQAVPV